MEKKNREITHWTGCGCNRGAFRRWHWGYQNRHTTSQNKFVCISVCLCIVWYGWFCFVGIHMHLLYFIRATVLEGEMWIGGVPAALTAATYWQSRDGLLGTPLPLNLWQVCACTTYSCWPCGTDGRDAVGCCQKNVLRWQFCAGMGRFVPDPVPFPFQTGTSHVPPLTHSPGEQMAMI